MSQTTTDETVDQLALPALSALDRCDLCGAQAYIRVTLASGEYGDVTSMPDPELERLRVDNPSARLLPLLRAIALTGPQTIVMNMLDDQRLVLRVEP